MTNEEKQEILDGLEPLFEEAQKSGYWLYCGYQDLWFEELRKEQSEGRYIWGAVNWKIRNPYERSNELAARIRNAQEAYDNFQRRVNK